MGEQIDTKKVRELLSNRFSDMEITTLAFDRFADAFNDFDINWSKPRKIQHLLEYCKRRHQLHRLLDVLAEMRPDVDLSHVWIKEEEPVGGKGLVEITIPEDIPLTPDQRRVLVAAIEGMLYSFLDMPRTETKVVSITPASSTRLRLVMPVSGIMRLLELEEHVLHEVFGFRDVTLISKDLKGIDLRNADLREMDLSNEDLNGAILSGSRMNGTNLSGSNLTYADFRDASLFGAKLVEANLRGANLVKAQLSGADLFRCDMSHADLGSALLLLAEMVSSNLHQANLERAFLGAVDLTNANVVQANLYEANLQEAKLTNVNLTGSTLTYANLIDADLKGAILVNADLRYADLTGANLNGTDFTNADLNHALLEKASTDIWTKGLSSAELDQNL